MFRTTSPRSAPPALVLALALLAIFGATGAAFGDPEVKITNSDQVYYPSRVKKGASYTKPAILTTSDVFDAIKEWKEIKKKKLTEKDAEYHLLLKKANEKFDCALKTVQLDGGYDIIAENGAISCKNVKAKDVTQDVIDALP